MTLDDSETRGDNARLDLNTLDLSAIDPDIDGGAEARFVSAVMSRTARASAPPRIPMDPLYGLWSLPHRTLIAASLLLALGALGAATTAHRRLPSSPETIADATGVPSAFLSSGAGRP